MLYQLSDRSTICSSSDGLTSSVFEFLSGLGVIEFLQSKLSKMVCKRLLGQQLSSKFYYKFKSLLADEAN